MGLFIFLTYYTSKRMQFHAMLEESYPVVLMILGIVVSILIAYINHTKK